MLDYQVLWFIGLLEIPFLLKLRDGSIDGTGDLGFDPLGLKQDSEAYAYNQARSPRDHPMRHIPTQTSCATMPGMREVLKRLGRLEVK